MPRWPGGWSPAASVALRSLMPGPLQLNRDGKIEREPARLRVVAAPCREEVGMLYVVDIAWEADVPVQIGAARALVRVVAATFRADRLVRHRPLPVKRGALPELLLDKRNREEPARGQLIGRARRLHRDVQIRQALTLALEVNLLEALDEGAAVARVGDDHKALPAARRHLWAHPHVDQIVERHIAVLLHTKGPWGRG
eukprot:CAMPEP_0185352162 /NCGR_PEP_ID=MMETSP1364-20130426/3829_1 /TAXON_ID=38817 /ORGANISM="Gephyrocapsa oceanica, Strain RCC1303" /LENGTH=197 /DNA_ID=CAMNT_0027951737 /DNA_START=157 /DNA_END=747 /DNA_ORIENTATION=+